MRVPRLCSGQALSVLVLAVATAAQAVPPTIPFSGRLSTSSGPVRGAVSISFQLFAGAAGGAALWSESHPALSAVEGLVFAELGSRTTLDGSLFNGEARFLELTVGSETLTPRLKLASVPYVFRADTVEHLGSLNEGDVQRSLTAGAGVALAGTTLSLSSAGCAASSVWKYNGTTFTCAPDALGEALSGGAGIAVGSGAVALSSAGCAAGAWWKYSGSSWECSPSTPSTDIGVMTSGTLSTNLYSAAADLAAEGHLDLNAAGDLLTRSQGDGRYFPLTGGALSGSLSVGARLTASSFQFATPRASILSLPPLVVVGVGPLGERWAYSADLSETHVAFAEGTTAGALPVNLPQAATLLSFSCVVIDNSDGQRVLVELRRVNNTDDVVLASAQTPLADVTTDWQTITATVSSLVIDNVGASYYLRVIMPPSTTSRLALRRCWLAYTTTTLR